MNQLLLILKYLPLAYHSYDEPANPFVGLVFALFGLVLAVIMVLSIWKIFSKAGEAGWKSLIPVYNVYIMYKISWGKGIYFLLMLVPIVNFFIGFVTLYKLGMNFGKSTGFTIGMMFLPYIFLPLLAFGDSKFLGIADGTGRYMPIDGMPYAQYGAQTYGGYQGQVPYQQGGYQGQAPYQQGGYQGQQPYGGYPGGYQSGYQGSQPNPNEYPGQAPYQQGGYSQPNQNQGNYYSQNPYQQGGYPSSNYPNQQSQDQWPNQN